MRLLDEPKQMVVELALLKNELVLVVGLGQRASQQQAPIVLRERLGFYNEPIEGSLVWFPQPSSRGRPHTQRRTRKRTLKDSLALGEHVHELVGAVDEVREDLHGLGGARGLAKDRGRQRGRELQRLQLLRIAHDLEVLQHTRDRRMVFRCRLLDGGSQVHAYVSERGL